jgi:quercetin 2,3-dioxygenase
VTTPELLLPREVPLGGPRAMTVRRTLPHRELRMIGAWCFIDSYGPDDVTATGGMVVPPHPHTGLQTVSWLYSGTVRHRDSLGHDQLITPGQLNLMTAGHGIAHSEDSVGDGALHGVQLWIALPASERQRPPAFAHHDDLPVLALGAATATVLVGALGGVASPAASYTPLVGAQLQLPAGTSIAVALQPGFEHGLLPGDGDLTVEGRAVPIDGLLHLPAGRTTVTLSTTTGCRLLLLGGEPFGERVVMWWNFLGTDHEGVAADRSDWQSGSARFGLVPGDRTPMAAPELPRVRLQPRGRSR